MPVMCYVALPFVRNEEGDLVPGDAQDRQSAAAAERLARRRAGVADGAVAFSRTGDPATGDFDDAVVIRAVGDVPTMNQFLRDG